MSPKTPERLESPCITCGRIKKGKNDCSLKCPARQAYADSFRGTDQMKAVDAEDSYRLMPMDNEKMSMV